MNGVAMVAGLLLAAALQARGQDTGEGASLSDVNLHDLTGVVQRVTRKTLLWTDELGLRGKRVHFVTHRRIADDPALLFAAYQHILQVHNLILVPAGKPGEEVYKIAAANTRGPVPVLRGELDPQDRFATRFFPLRFVSARTAYTAILSMVSAPQNVTQVDEAGLLIVTDYESNLRRLEEVLLAIDVKKPDIEMRMVPLRNAVAVKVEEKMNALVKTLVGRPAQARMVPGMPQAGDAEPLQIVADERTNSVMILAEPGRIQQLEEIARRLDSETPFESAGIHFVHLRHRDALDVAKRLNALYRITVDDKGVPAGGAPSRAGTPGPGPAVPGAASLPVSSPAGMEPTIVPDPLSNSLLIIADRNTFRTLEQVVRSLDRRRPQVHIKATVVEIAATEDFDLGVELARVEAPGKRFVVNGRTSFALSGFQADPANDVFTITPVLTAGATLLGMRDRIGNIPAILHVLEGKAKVSILDEPEAVTNDHGAARMTAITEVPVAQTTFQGQAGAFAQNSFKYETAETTLSISPHVSEGGYLRLETTVKIQKFTGTSTDPQAPPGRASREIMTREVLVPSGGSMVIGGIVTSDQSATQQGVPPLSHFPLFGWLFQREIEKKEKRTLYIFITPTILCDHGFGDYHELSRDRKFGIERLRGEKVQGLRVDAGSSGLPDSTFRLQPPQR